MNCINVGMESCPFLIVLEYLCITHPVHEKESEDAAVTRNTAIVSQTSAQRKILLTFHAITSMIMIMTVT